MAEDSRGPGARRQSPSARRPRGVQLYWIRRLPVSPHEPLAELPRGLDRRAAVEGHEGRRSTGQPGNLRAPPIGADFRHLDQVLAAVDDFFEAVDRHDAWCFELRDRTIRDECRCVILVDAQPGSSERKVEDARRSDERHDSHGNRPKKNPAVTTCTMNPRSFHSFSTAGGFDREISRRTTRVPEAVWCRDLFDLTSSVYQTST